jgi:hypothetical protein
MPTGQANARQQLGCRGVYYDVGIGPKGFCSSFFPTPEQMQEKYGGGPYGEIEGGRMFLGQKSNALFATANMLMRFDYTRDLDYLHKVYPFLTQVADFWEDYLVLEDGRYVIRDDTLHEVGPWQGEGWEQGYGDVNPVLSLGMLRTFYGAMLDASRALGVDAERRETWHQILERLSDFPTTEIDGRRTLQGAQGEGSGSKRVGLEWVMLHGLVWPSRLYGLDSDPGWLKLLRDEMERWSEAEWIDHGNHFQTVFPAAALIGLDPERILSLLQLKLARYSYPNLFIRQEGGGIEVCSGVPATINAMLLQRRGGLQQRRDGLLQLFPVWPRDRETRFYRLRARGALLVSSALAQGRVQYVVLESEREQACKVVNPWPGEGVGVVRDGVQGSMRGEPVLAIDLAAGEHVRLVPEWGASFEAGRDLRS